LAGIFPALTTPYGEDGLVAVDRSGPILGSTTKPELPATWCSAQTGESVLLSSVEAELLLVAAKETAVPGKTLIAGTAPNPPPKPLPRTKRAAELGFDVASLKRRTTTSPPISLKSIFATIGRCRCLANSGAALLRPIFTGVSLETPEILELANHPNIIGIKDSSGVIQRSSK